MRCIKLTAPNGDVRFIGMNRPFRRTPGDVVTIGECEQVEDSLAGVEFKGVVESAFTTNKNKPLLHELDQEIGPGFGDLIKRLVKPVAKLTGKDRCTQCEVRRIVSNAYGRLKDKHGQIKALGMIGELWKMSTTGTDEEVFNKLKSYLNEEVRS